MCLNESFIFMHCDRSLTYGNCHQDHLESRDSARKDREANAGISLKKGNNSEPRGLVSTSKSDLITDS
jgi:hypothetical protein